MTMGKVLARIGEIPDLVYTSTAERARETVMLAADAGAWNTNIVEVDDLYETSAGAALRIAGNAPDAIERLMLVGHQPTWSSLIHSITGASVDVKTATVAAIDMRMERWALAPVAMGGLVYLLQPRLFENWEL